VAWRVLAAARECGKPVVVNFLGGDPAAVGAGGMLAAASLEEAAEAAVVQVARVLGQPVPDHSGSATDPAWTVLSSKLKPTQRRIRGLYSGGTLCSEATLILAELLPPVDFSLVDLGDDEYTVGRPHPMIDFRLRNEQIEAAAEDPATAVILLDVVLGYGSHPDPAGALQPALERAQQRAGAGGRRVLVVGSVCGTAADPQGLEAQEARLRECGMVLLPSNASAARAAARIVSGPR
jgi:hypothetical protein